MHTLHYIAVVADSKQEAFEEVLSACEPDEYGMNFAQWSDWCVVGGGRWNSDPANQYADVDNDVISYYHEMDKFLSAINDCKERRAAEMRYISEQISIDLLKQHIDTFIQTKGDVPDEVKYNMNNYYVRNAAKLLSDQYSPDSYFYDLDVHSASLSYLYDRIQKPDEKDRQFLVPVDFHY